MPYPLPPTPWLNPPDYVGSYLKGAALGIENARLQQSAAADNARLQQAAAAENAQISLAQQRLAQSAAESQAKMELQERLEQQRMLERQQRAEIANQIQLSRIGLEQQRLEETKAMNMFKVGQVARQYQAQRAVSARAQEMMTAGVESDPVKAQMRAVAELAPEMGLTSQQFASTINNAAAMQQRQEQFAQTQRLAQEREKRMGEQFQTTQGLAERREARMGEQFERSQGLAEERLALTQEREKARIPSITLARYHEYWRTVRDPELNITVSKGKTKTDAYKEAKKKIDEAMEGIRKIEAQYPMAKDEASPGPWIPVTGSGVKVRVVR